VRARKLGNQSVRGESHWSGGIKTRGRSGSNESQDQDRGKRSTLRVRQSCNASGSLPEKRRDDLQGRQRVATSTGGKKKTKRVIKNKGIPKDKDYNGFSAVRHLMEEELKRHWGKTRKDGEGTPIPGEGTGVEREKKKRLLITAGHPM